MNFKLTRFTILGLHGKYDVDIPIIDNKLILIGVNGLGKTTVINFIYFVLSEQWSRISDYTFYAITLIVNERTVLIAREEILQRSRTQRTRQRIISSLAAKLGYPVQYVSRVISHPLFIEIPHLDASSTASAIKLISEAAAVPTFLTKRIVSEQADNEYLRSINQDIPICFQELSFALSRSPEQQIVYLPTYRRIEQDLKSIFPNSTEEDIKKLVPASSSLFDGASKSYIELVQFGMQDVEKKIQNEIASIQESTREQLTGLTGSYLQDIIRSRADSIDPDVVNNMTDDVVSKVLRRVEEHTLNDDDKNEVRNAIRRLRSERTRPASRDVYLAYFFSRLLDIYSDLGKSEASVRRLVETCNRYFVGKTLHYDDVNFTTSIIDDQSLPLHWKVLSSGEKQVASLFTHLFLSSRRSQIVLIDEPELSLSVRWQKRLLPDVLSTHNCSLLIAVTHSPFIYKNELDKYAVDLGKLIFKNTSH